jgi:hypothetical protein
MLLLYRGRKRDLAKLVLERNPSTVGRGVQAMMPKRLPSRYVKITKMALVRRSQ